MAGHIALHCRFVRSGSSTASIGAHLGAAGADAVILHYRMQPLPHIDPNDLKALMALEPVHLLGAILRLNQLRYHNTLNAVVLACTLMELQREQVPVDKPDRS